MRRRTKRGLIILAVLPLGALAYWSYLNRSGISAVPKPTYADDAQTTAGHQPRICVGLNAGGGYGATTGDCPPNYAIMMSQDSSGESEVPPHEVPLVTFCCRLPADDILSNEHVYNVSEECPFNHVMTGGAGNACGSNCTVRCTRINTARYKLGNKFKAFYWKREGSYPAAGRGDARQIKHHEIPAAIRYANGRIGPNDWQLDGCIGVPFGSLMTQKSSMGCGGYYYRPLLFADGRAVRMFPECRDVSGKDTATPGCEK